MSRLRELEDQRSKNILSEGEYEKTLAAERDASLKALGEEGTTQRSQREAESKQLRSLEATVRKLGVVDSPRELYLRIAAREHSLQKDEFETTAAYTERSARGWVAPIFAERTLDDLYAFRVDSAKAAYDADSGVMRVSISAEESTGVLNSGVKALGLHTDLWEGRRYVGENAFGAILNVEKLYSDTYELQLDRRVFAASYTFEEKMEADEAKRAKPALGIVAICHLTAPFVSHDGFLKKPTFESPTDMAFMIYRLVGWIEQLWLVDFRRREILKRTQFEGTPSVSTDTGRAVQPGKEYDCERDYRDSASRREKIDFLYMKGKLTQEQREHCLDFDPWGPHS